MADGQNSPTVQGKVCTKCGEWKSLAHFAPKYRRVVRPRGDGRRCQCRPCTASQNRARYAARSEVRAKACAANLRRKRAGLQTVEQRRKWRRTQRAKWVAQGLTTKGTARQKPPARRRPPSDGYESLALQNAAQAWIWWVKVKAPGWWVREAYRDRPWTNPRLTKAGQWRIRYWCNPEFRAREIEKVQRLKVRRRDWIDRNNDGTLTADAIMRLFADAKMCSYCGRTMRSVEKSLDHVVPLSRGGAHSITNVVIACKPCNFSKHTATLEEWGGRAA